MVSKHSKEEEQYMIFNNHADNSSSESDTDNDNECNQCLLDNRDYKVSSNGTMPNFIYNDLKGIRKGGPLMDNGKQEGATASPSGPITRRCPACRKNSNKLFKVKWFRCPNDSCNKAKVKWVCDGCAFGQQCPWCKKTRKPGYNKEDDGTEERKKDKEKLIMWKSGDMW